MEIVKRKEKNEKREDIALKVTWIGLYVNIALTAFKIVAGILGRSGAMVADAIHSLSDFATDIVVLFGFNFVKKPADADHDYGHAKFETLIAVIIGALLFIVGIFIMVNGIKNIIYIASGNDIKKPNIIAFIAAFVSITVKEWLYRYTIKTGKKINSSAIIANAWHHRSDALSSVSTLIGIGFAVFLGNKWVIFDPIAAFVMSFFIIKVAIEITKSSTGDLLDQSLSKEVEDEMIDLIKKIDGIKNPHKIRTRRIGNDYFIDIHIEVDPNISIKNAHEIATKVEDNVRNRYGENTDIIVHVEPYEIVDEINGGI